MKCSDIAAQVAASFAVHLLLLSISACSHVAVGRPVTGPPKSAEFKSLHMETQNLRLPVERVYREEKQGWEAVIPEGFHWLPNEESHFFWLQPPDSSKDLGFMAVFTPQEIASPLSQTDLLQVLRAAAHEMTAELGWGSTPVEAKFSHTAFGDGVELSGQGPAEGKRIGTFRVFAVSLCSGRAAILFGAGWIREKEGAILNRFADSVRPIADGELPLCALKHR